MRCRPTVRLLLLIVQSQVILITGKNMAEQFGVIWITGLSAAGKTTTANCLAKLLREDHENVIVLDGDILREVFGVTAAHARSERLDIAMRYARLCRALASQRAIVIIATISLFAEIHSFNRANLPNYFEVYLKVPITELKKRDPKGIYRRYEAGELSDVAGLDIPIDEPENPDFLAHFDPQISPETLAADIMRNFYAKFTQIHNKERQ